MEDELAHRLEQRASRVATSCASPPTMIVSVPDSAPGEEPVTGASRRRAHARRAWRRAPRPRRARSSTCRRRACPAARSVAAPSGPSSTASTSGPSTTIVITSSAPAARVGRAVRDGARRWLGPAHPRRSRRCGSRRSARSRRASRFAAIREPMIPRPRNADAHRPIRRGLVPCPPPPGVSIRRRSPAAGGAAPSRRAPRRRAGCARGAVPAAVGAAAARGGGAR